MIGVNNKECLYSYSPIQSAIDLTVMNIAYEDELMHVIISLNDIHLYDMIIILSKVREFIQNTPTH